MKKIYALDPPSQAVLDPWRSRPFAPSFSSERHPAQAGDGTFRGALPGGRAMKATILMLLGMGLASFGWAAPSTSTRMIRRPRRKSSRWTRAPRRSVGACARGTASSTATAGGSAGASVGLFAADRARGPGAVDVVEAGLAGVHLAHAVEALGGDGARVADIGPAETESTLAAEAIAVDAAGRARGRLADPRDAAQRGALVVGRARGEGDASRRGRAEPAARRRAAGAAAATAATPAVAAFPALEQIDAAIGREEAPARPRGGCERERGHQDGTASRAPRKRRAVVTLRCSRVNRAGAAATIRRSRTRRARRAAPASAAEPLRSYLT